jgi:cobalt-zinc-cadmium efflux system membrane fusion protein
VKRVWWLALVLLAGCSRGKEPVRAESAPAKPAAPEGVELTADQQKEAGVQWATVQPRSMPETLRVSGRLTVNENRTWHVGAITEGRVIRIYANTGDTVGAGQVLARLHSHEIHEARSEFKKAKAEVVRVTAQEAYMRRLRDRAKRLLDLKAASQEQLEHAESEWRKAVIDLENAKTEESRTRTHLEDFLDVPAEPPADHKDGETEHEDDLIPVKAPAAGHVLKRIANVGSVVTAGEEMFELTDVSNIWMIAAVPEEHLGKVRAGMNVNVEVQAYPGTTFRGRIARIADTLDPATRTAQVRVELASAGGKLKPEMYAVAEIATGGSAPSMFVPEAAVQELKNQKVVFVRDEQGRFQPRPVDVGRSLNGETEIRAGLKTGDAVVTKGAFTLKSQLLKSSLSEE